MVDKIKKPKPVSIKERKLIKARIEGKSVTESAKEAGMGRTYASKSIERPQVKELIATLLDKAGLTDEKLANKIAQLSEAKETKFFAHQGIVMDEKETEAIETQRSHSLAAAGDAPRLVRPH